jgi:hypothetical protein
LINIYSDKSLKNHIVTYNMNNGQTAIWEYGKKIQ